RRFGVGEEEILGLVHSERLRDLLAFEADRAGSFFDEAERALPAADRGAARPARVMGRLYRRLLDKMRAGEFRVFAERPRLSVAEKIICLVGG
ncbi:MAG TPA: squalene/phytoene synthase family protein, partial [Elusimicrobiota bacterium]|nr:squalene/phytoene synthase family protein [Elusimicrobiota bacterium]